jgi:hypothetical protein
MLFPCFFRLLSFLIFFIIFSSFHCFSYFLPLSVFVCVSLHSSCSIFPLFLSLFLRYCLLFFFFFFFLLLLVLCLLLWKPWPTLEEWCYVLSKTRSGKTCHTMQHNECQPNRENWMNFGYVASI